MADSITKPLEPFRRTPGTVDPGADFARQLSKQRVPPVGEILKDVSVDSTGYQFVSHNLGRAYVCAQVAGYSTFRAGVYLLSPSETQRRGKNPANTFGVYGLAASGANILDVWIF